MGRRLLPGLALAAAIAAAAGAAPPPGDAERGAALYGRCKACHSLERNRTGPKHCGLVGRPAGSVPGYAYSEAMRQAGLVWTPEALDRFLADPRGAVPGTRMGYAGVKDAQERADLIAYLTAATEDAPACR
jgi:cytochrome c